MFSKSIEKIIYIFLIFSISIILIKSSYLGNFYWQFSSLFVDHNHFIDWLECDAIGVNLFTSEKLICNNRDVATFNYGNAILILPWNQSLDIFYRDYLPYVLIFIFILLTIKIINPQNNKDRILLFLCILNPSTLLAFDRLNVDLFIYVFAIIICFNRIYLINWLLTLFVSFIKVYPATLFVNIFFENLKRSLKSIMIIIIFIFLLTVVYFFYFKDYVLFFLNNISGGKAGYHYLFSLNSLPKILKYVFDFNYQILLIIFYSLFIYSVVKFYKKYTCNIEEIDDDIFSLNSKLFMIAGFLSIISFSIFSNWFYREIFLILMLPYVLHNKIGPTYSFNNLFIHILVIRYIFLFIYGYINIHDNLTYVESVRVFSSKFLIIIFIKSIFDFFIMGIFSAILFRKSKLCFKRLMNS